MAVAGVGGLVGNLFFPDLDKNLARQMTPNPNPLAQQGPGPQNPKAVDSLGNPVPMQSPQPSMAPAASTQPDPVNASYNENLISAGKRDAMAQGINSGLDSIAAGFGTAQQQASKQNAIRQGGVGSSLLDLAGIQHMQDQTIADNEHARFMGNAHIFGETLRRQGINVTDAQATEIMNNKEWLGQETGAAASNVTQTGTTKDADAATRAWAAANPKATPQEIESYRANLIAGGMGGSDLDQREYLAAKAADPTIGTFADWKARHAAEAAGLVTHEKNVTESRDQAIVDYPTVDASLSRSEDIIKKLLANKQATIDAINTMPSRKTGWWAANTPWGASEEIRTAAADLQTLMSTLAGDNLKNVKNVRNIKEFQTLADSLVAGLRAGNTDEGIESTLNGLLQRFDTTRSIAREQAGYPAEEPKKDEGGGGGPASSVKRRHYNEKGELVD